MYSVSGRPLYRPRPQPRLAAWALPPAPLHKDAAIAAPLVAKRVAQPRLFQLSRTVPGAFAAAARHRDHLKGAGRDLPCPPALQVERTGDPAKDRADDSDKCGHLPKLCGDH